MKKIFLSVLAFILTLLLTVSVFPAMLSPGLENLSVKRNMVVSFSEEYTFTENDFSDFLGGSVKTVTILSLPPEKDGFLYIGNNKAEENQTISAGNLNLLKFIPKDGITATSFKFAGDRLYTVECDLIITERENISPVSSISDGVARYVTFRDVEYNGILCGYDPDGDDIKFEITRYPSEGVVELVDNTTGVFSYTPYSGYIGTDSFSYKISDEFGSYSDETEVVIATESYDKTGTFSDLNGEYGEVAATFSVNNGYIDAVTENKVTYFDPDEQVTRIDFLKSVMKFFGIDEVNTDTVFTDCTDSELSDITGTAYKLGIINGYNAGEQSTFRPDDIITHSEACALVNNIINLSPSDKELSFSTYHGISDCYLECISVSNEYGMSEFVLSPDEGLTKLECAEILYNLDTAFIFE